VVHQHRLFHTVNIFLKRNSDKHPFNPKGRNQNEFEAIEIDRRTRDVLQRCGVDYHEVEVDNLDAMWGQILSILRTKARLDLPEDPKAGWSL
jgi:hypothetical protein